MQLIRGDIALGRRQPGDRLPPVRALAESLGVNVNTVARAYSELARDGTISANRGGGSYVAVEAGSAIIAERRASQLQDILSDAVLRALSLGHDPAEIEREVGSQLRRWSSAANLGKTPSLSSPRQFIRFSGSHDLALELLAARLGHQTPALELRLDFTGSTAGLMALLLGEVEFAGCHLGHENDDTTEQVEIQRLLPSRPLLLVTLARRQQGLIVPRGNPRAIRDISDLTRDGVVTAVRQAGSGTRILQDRLLCERGYPELAPGSPSFETHAQVAAAIAQGNADVGLGILAAARTYGLDFIPIDWETYTLVIPAEISRELWVADLLEALRSEEFRRIVHSLGGYDTERMGECRRVSVS